MVEVADPIAEDPLALEAADYPGFELRYGIEDASEEARAEPAPQVAKGVEVARACGRGRSPLELVDVAASLGPPPI